METYVNTQKDAYNDWQEIDIIVSRDCTLRCTYCYLHHHTSDKNYNREEILISFDKLLDFLHNNNPEGPDKPEGIVVGFYPEPWVNVNQTNSLIKDALAIILKYPRFVDNYMIMLGTNGALLHIPIPILKSIRNNLSISVTIDGIKEQHDMYRVFKSGKGSWDIVRKNILKYQEEFGIYNTKVTIGPATIKYIYESSLFLWDDMNLNDININVVFENLWGTKYEKQKSLEEFEEQLSKLYYYVVKNQLWKKNRFVSFLGHRHIPWEVSKDQHISSYMNQTFCGAAMMRSIDVDGGIYPCFRLSPYSLNKESQFRINENDFTKNAVRALNSLNNYDACQLKCLECPLLSSCSMCVGGSIEEKNSLYYRTTNHCEFQKIQYKWALKLYNYMNPNPEEKIEYVL